MKIWLLYFLYLFHLVFSIFLKFELGNIYRLEKKFNDAECYYKKAIHHIENSNEPNLKDTVPFPYHGLGFIYYHKNDYSEAIKQWNIAHKGFENRCEQLKKWEVSKCIKILKKLEESKNRIRENRLCIDGYDLQLISVDKTGGLVNKGSSLVIVALVDTKLRIRIFDACGGKVVDKEESELCRGEALTILKEQLNLLPDVSVLPQEDKQKIIDNVILCVGLSRIEYKVLEATDEIERNIERTKVGLDDFLKIKSYDMSENGKNYVQVLRQWNSYTPIMSSSQNYSKGGGYFLNVEKIGIVIDPGFNFIENFIDSGHKFHEINKIFISHAHNDHTADIESILTLLHKYNENAKGTDYIEKILEREELNPSTIYTDLITKLDGNNGPDKITKELINDTFKNHPYRKTIDFYMTLSVFQKYAGVFKLFSDQNYTIQIVEAGEEMYFDIYKDNRLSVKVLTANHHDIISDNKSVGFCFAIKNKGYYLVYTGDTGYSDKLGKEYESIRKDAEKENINSIQLISHLGGFKNYEWFYPISNNSKYFYKNHLGRLGLVKLIENLKPHICY